MKIENTKISSFFALSDVVSLLNMLCGFFSIIANFNGKFYIAAVLIICSIVFDSVDGWVARKINRNDEFGFGKNIDSLSDAVSFGASPAIFLYCISKTIADSPTIAVVLIAAFMVVCGILRLTRYNAINDYISFEGFIGFPIPGIAIILVSYYFTGLFNIYVAMVLMAIISIFMISNLKYKKLDNVKILIISVILIILMIFPLSLSIFDINIPALILLLICLYYLITGLIK